MRINVYAQELTDRVEKVSRHVDGVLYQGLRIYLYLPVTSTPGLNMQTRGPFIHRDGDDDSAAITFWGDTADLCDLVNAICKANML